MNDTPHAFEAHLGSVFTVEHDTGQVELRLVDVQRLGAQPGAPREEPFALVWSGPADAPLEEQIHRMAHDALGEMEIFLVATGPLLDGSLRYQAIFS